LSPSRKPELKSGRKSGLPNYNVVLELGIAIAFGIPILILLKSGTFEVSDLQGWYWIQYKKHDEIAAELTKKIKTNDGWDNFLKLKEKI
jgi:hypothetical protein